MKKLIIAVFVLSLVALPSTTRAGFFDFFRTNQSAQVKTAVKSDNLILQVQQALAAQGFYKGDMSGVVGAKTKTAIKSFQKMNKLPVTGLLDQNTVNAILKSGGPQSGGVFESRLCNSQTPPRVRVISPNGGESYQAGQEITARWETCNLPYNAPTLVAVMDDRIPDWQTLSLFGSVPALDHATLVSSAGNRYVYEYSFVAPATFNDSLPPQYQNIYGGLHYKILANVALNFGTPDQQIFEDLSDNLFSIVGGGNCVVATEETNPFVSNVPSTNVAPFSASYTNLYNEMSVFRIQNPTNCPMTISKLSIVSAATDGLEFVEKADLRLKTLDDGNVFSPTNIGPNYTDSNAYFTILDTIPANSYKDYSVGTSDIHYFDPYQNYGNLNWGGVAVGVGQVDFELPGLPLPVWNGNTVNPSPFGPIWGPVITVQQ